VTTRGHFEALFADYAALVSARKQLAATLAG
jgi:hypothetical protein